jgi:TetR/AcrR family transcriptional regulator, cholesterol catabolism regulator
MDSTFRGIIEKFRDYLNNENGRAIIDLDVIAKNIGVSRKLINSYVKNEAELVEKVLDFERHRFEEIFSIYTFDGVNAIDVLLMVSKEVADKFVDISPSVTFVLKQHFPEIYHQHFILRRDFIYEKIQLNLSKGIRQGMYRDDLSVELIARLYLSRLSDLHNPDFFPAEEFSSDTIFNVMFENFIRGIAKPEGLAYFEDKKKNFINGLA